jgi:hypothetical protein
MGLMDVFKKLNSEASSAELRAALEKLDESAAFSAVEKAEADRQSLLIDGDDRQLAKAESALAAARLDLERVLAGRDELSKRITQAEEREAKALLDAEFAGVKKEADAVAMLLTKEYPRMAREFVDLLDRLSRTEQRVIAVNQKIAEAGRTEFIPAIEKSTLARDNPYWTPFDSILSRLSPAYFPYVDRK